MNQVSFIGRLVADPRLRTVTGDRQVCQCRIAVDGGGPRRETGFFDVAQFGDGGAAAARVLRKGWLVGFHGRAEFREWTTKDDQQRSAVAFVGTLQFLAPPNSQRAHEHRADGNGHRAAA